MSSLGDALHRTVGVLEEEGNPYMLIGGLAVVVWGEPRATRDVDVTVDLGGVSPRDFVAVARRVGEPLAEDPEDLAERGRVIPVLTPAGVAVDLVLALLSFEIEAIRRAVPINVEGRHVRVCGAEDLLLHKVVSERPRDHEDVIGILRRQARVLELDALDEAVATVSEELGEPQVRERWEAARSAAGL